MNDINIKKPKIAVLMAAYNGALCISAQITSIQHQQDVMVDLYISLDKSNDESLNLINKIISQNNNIHLLPYGDTFGNAGKNFYRLICDVDLSKYDYISFSDQDDLWLPRKLITSVKKIADSGASCYSSDVLAVWPKTGKSLVIKKSQPQVEYDYIFEAAGPGCTYVLKKDFALSLQNFIKKNKVQVLQIKLHDWFIYSFARSRSEKWLIDDSINMHYIQHGNNLVGVNNGFSAYKKRITSIFNNDWINQVCKIYSITHIEKQPHIEGLKNYKKSSLLKISFNSKKYRRKIIDSLALKFFMILLILKNGNPN